MLLFWLAVLLTLGCAGTLLATQYTGGNTPSTQTASPTNTPARVHNLTAAATRQRLLGATAPTTPTPTATATANTVPSAASGNGVPPTNTAPPPPPPTNPPPTAVPTIPPTDPPIIAPTSPPTNTPTRSSGGGSKASPTP